MRDAVAFERSSPYDKDLKRYVPVYLIKCTGCEKEDHIKITKKAGSLPNEIVRKKFGQMGWLVGRTRKHDLCPQCVAAKATEKYPSNGAAKNGSADQQTAAETEAMNDSKDPLPPAEGNNHDTNQENGLAAESPRAPTPQENRRIVLALDDHFDAANSAYRDGMTDASLAEQLDVPRKWVMDIREQFFGPIAKPDISHLKTQIEEFLKEKRLIEKRSDMLIEALGKVQEIGERLERQIDDLKQE